MKTTVNERLRFLREELNLTREQLAMISTVSSSAITKIESGHMEVSAQNERKLLAVLNPSANWWATGKGTDYFAIGTTEENKKRVEALTFGNATANPWKDEAYTQLKEEVTYLRDMLKMALGSKNFLKSFEKAYGGKLFPSKEQYATVSGDNLRASA